MSIITVITLHISPKKNKMRPVFLPLPLQRLLFLIIIVLIASIATATPAGLWARYPRIELQIDPPVLERSVFTMPMKRYWKRNDRIYGHIHFDYPRVIKSVSILRGPHDAVCYVQLGWGMRMEKFNYYRPFEGHAQSWFVTCLVRDPKWHIDY